VTWQLTVPAPCEWINSNHRTHRMEVAKRTRLWRDATYAAALDQAVFYVPVRITATVHKTRNGVWDAGNLYPTAKAIVDGLVDAGVLRDDSNRYVIGPDMRAGDKRDTACVVIRIEAIA